VLGAPEILKPFLAHDAHLGTFLEEQVALGMRVLLFAWHPEMAQLQLRKGEAQLPHGLVPLSGGGLLRFHLTASDSEVSSSTGRARAYPTRQPVISL
jgi:hypothetical protein